MYERLDPFESENVLVDARLQRGSPETRSIIRTLSRERAAKVQPRLRHTLTHQTRLLDRYRETPALRESVGESESRGENMVTTCAKWEKRTPQHAKLNGILTGKQRLSLSLSLMPFLARSQSRDARVSSKETS